MYDIEVLSINIYVSIFSSGKKEQEKTNFKNHT